jgi:hypothetical protein
LDSAFSTVNDEAPGQGDLWQNAIADDLVTSLSADNLLLRV